MTENVVFKGGHLRVLGISPSYHRAATISSYRICKHFQNFGGVSKVAANYSTKNRPPFCKKL